MLRQITKNFIILLLTILTIACETPKSTPLIVNEPQTTTLLWHRITNSFQLQHWAKNPTVAKYIRQYSKSSHNITKFSHYAAPYLYHVVENLEQYHMPGELALLPMIESAYKPTAQSHKGAVGIWQINAITAKHFNMRQDHWLDERKDIAASTTTALNHLNYLYQEFNQDWLLALAAYNCGSSRVKKIINYNKKHNKPTDFWSLPLPKETKAFVPKLLALSYIIQNAKEFDIKLHHIVNKPYFTTVEIGSQMQLQDAARLAQIELKELKSLNPAYNKHLTHPEGPHKLVIPTTQVSIFKANLLLKKQATTNTNVISHIVQTGDTLSILACRYNTTISQIKSYNKITNDIIILGKELIIPLKA